MGTLNEGVERIPEPDCSPMEEFRWRKDVAAALRSMSHRITSMEETVRMSLREMGKRLDSIYQAVAGTPTEGGLRDRVERLEEVYGLLRKVMWQLVVALFLFLLQGILRRLGVL